MERPDPMTPAEQLRSGLAGRAAVWAFLSFAAGYYLSYLYRTVNAVLAPALGDETGLQAADLGLLTSTYFLAFVVSQIPIGILLDRYGPRRVEASLLLVGGAGALVFAAADGLPGLLVGRALIGLGVSACLMAAFKAFVLWFPPDRLPLLNGLTMAAGGLGALTATRPVEWMLATVGWRPVFVGLALATVAVALMVFLAVPETGGRGRAVESLSAALRGVRRVFTSPVFLRLAPLAVVSQAIFLALQGLWAGPWLADVAGLDRRSAADVMLAVAVALVIGHLGGGAAASALTRRGRNPQWIFVTGSLALLAIEGLLVAGWRGPPTAVWVPFGLAGATGILSYALLTRAFPAELAGRVNTALNMLVFIAAFIAQWGIGAVIGLWPRDEGGAYPEMAYQAAFATVLVAHVAAFGWFVRGRRRAGSGFRPH